MKLLKSPLEIECPNEFCKAKVGENCYYIYSPTEQKFDTAPHVYRQEAMEKENKRRVCEEMK